MNWGGARSAHCERFPDDVPEVLERNLHACWRRHHRFSPAARHLLEIAVAEYRPR